MELGHLGWAAAHSLDKLRHIVTTGASLVEPSLMLQTRRFDRRIMCHHYDRRTAHSCVHGTLVSCVVIPGCRPEQL
jgi:hypothetical protein